MEIEKGVTKELKELLINIFSHACEQGTNV
jgi:hypothetical protein